MSNYSVPVLVDLSPLAAANQNRGGKKRNFQKLFLFKSFCFKNQTLVTPNVIGTMATTHRKGKRVVDPVPKWYDTVEAESVKLKNTANLTSTVPDLLKMRSCMVSPMRPGASTNPKNIPDI